MAFAFLARGCARASGAVGRVATVAGAAERRYGASVTTRVPSPRPPARRLPPRPDDAAPLEALRWAAFDETPEHMATFPEQNPNLVVELDPRGSVAYCNPVARARFPDLTALGADHPILAGALAIGEALQREGRDFSSREVDLGDAVFEQKICPTPNGDIRVYAHDVTARKRAEKEIQALAQRVVSAQEEERQRIARELHDDAGQALTALRISLELIRADVPEAQAALRADLLHAARLVGETHERLRLLARGLRPPSLDQVGLSATLAAHCRDFASRTQLEIAFASTGEPRLSGGAEIALYRAVQEALTNVARHAEAREVTVELSAAGGEAFVRVVDDGRGYEPAQGTPGGVGLRGMRERLELLGGRLIIASASGGGTELTAWVPLEPPT